MTREQPEEMNDLHTDLVQIKALLKKPDLILGFPLKLENEYREESQKHSIQFFVNNGYYILIIYFVIALSQRVWLDGHSKEFDTWVISYLNLGLTLTGALVCARIKRLNPYFNFYIPFWAFLGLADVLNFPGFVQERLFVLTGYFGIFYVVVIIYTLSGLNAWLALLANAAALMTIPVVQYFAPYSIDLFMLSHSFIGINILSLILSCIADRHRRRQFLQNKLITIEKNRADALAKAMERMSRLDKLTGIANRRYFDLILEKEWKRGYRDNTPITLLFIDIDFFKKYNDNFGHQAGDDTLIKVAQLINNQTKRPGDLAARYGGEEFAMIYPRIDTEDGDQLAERVLTSIFECNYARNDLEQFDRVTVSLGVATIYPTKNNNIDQLIKAADAALYKAKSKGRNQWSRLTHEEMEQHGIPI